MSVIHSGLKLSVFRGNKCKSYLSVFQKFSKVLPCKTHLFTSIVLYSLQCKYYKSFVKFYYNIFANFVQKTVYTRNVRVEVHKL